MHANTGSSIFNLKAYDFQAAGILCSYVRIIAVLSHRIKEGILFERAWKTEVGLPNCMFINGENKKSLIGEPSFRAMTVNRDSECTSPIQPFAGICIWNLLRLLVCKKNE